MNILKATIFYPLMMVRRLVLSVGKVASWIFVLGGVLEWFLDKGSTRWSMSLAFVLLGVGLFVLCQLYDQLLLKLNPTGHELVLYQ